MRDHPHALQASSICRTPASPQAIPALSIQSEWVSGAVRMIFSPSSARADFARASAHGINPPLTAARACRNVRRLIITSSYRDSDSSTKVCPAGVATSVAMQSRPNYMKDALISFSSRHRNRSGGDQAGGDSNRGGAGRDVAKNHAHRADLGAVADAYPAQHLRVGAKLHVVFQNGGRPIVVAIADRHALAQGAVGSDLRIPMHEDVAEMMDPQPRPNLNILWNADAGERFDNPIGQPVRAIADSFYQTG